MIKKFTYLTSALFLLSGCVSDKERMIKEGYPKLYAQGYEDGCYTGRSMAGGFGNMEKKVRLYESDKDYFHGWNDGRDMCYQTQKSLQEADLQYALKKSLEKKKK